MKTYSIQEINNVLKGSLIGTLSQNITSPEQLDLASENQISFIGNKKYEKYWSTSKASAAIVNEDISIEPGTNKAFIKVKNAELAMSQLLALFAPPPPQFDFDVHPTATIDDSVNLGKGVKIGAGCYLGPNVIIGDNVTIYPNATLLDFTSIGSRTTI